MSGARWPLPACGLWLVLLLSPGCCRAGPPKPTRRPFLSGRALLLAWNAPTEDCRPRYSVDLDLGQFEIRASPNEGFVGQNLTIFYKDRLGLYPYFERSGRAVNTGLPQTSSLDAHLQKMPEGVNKYIRDPSARGLAVIDWEEWRPLWIRNWDAKDVYRSVSRNLTARRNPTWSKEEVNKVAQQEFEASARAFMLGTLRHAKHLRPHQLWGFYLFPDCYNHDYKNSLENYTGRCPDVEVSRNDQLAWLWAESTALFPSIYVGSVLRSSPFGRQFVRNRVREGMRLAQVGEGPARPVFVYTRPTYTNEMELLTEMDLVSTIGESVALGVAGIIFWGDSTYASSVANCNTLNEYLRGALGRYLVNVSTAAEQCSKARCSAQGRCLRRNPNTDTYLHLSPQSFSIQREGGRLQAQGLLTAGERDYFQREFQCQCYSGHRGESCAQREAGGGSGGAPGLRAAVSSVLPALALLRLLL
ncbi:hyaluronidase-2 [Lepisosteus oculatus]|uniref:hyaluronidase-2 n=1 Tax=Lepisosteus oculatus TaxID=7918 RepID=UPI00371C663A